MYSYKCELNGKVMTKAHLKDHSIEFDLRDEIRKTREPVYR